MAAPADGRSPIEVQLCRIPVMVTTSQAAEDILRGGKLSPRG